MAKKANDSPHWSKRRKSTSTGYTGKWPAPLTTTDAADSEEQKARQASFWQTVASLTSLGWLLALPIGVSVLVGCYIDKRLASGHFWTLTFLGVGIGLAIVEGYLMGSRTLRKNYSEKEQKEKNDES